MTIIDFFLAYIPGYTVGSGQNTLTIACNANGEWATPVQRCVRSQCGSPPFVEGATVVRYNRRVDFQGSIFENATYRCAEGTWISDGFYKVITLF